MRRVVPIWLWCVAGVLVLLIALTCYLTFTYPSVDPVIQSVAPIATLAATVLTFVYVVVTNDMVNSMVASSKEESRPYVTVNFVVEPDHVVNLVISNAGRTAAGSISTKIEPDLIGLQGSNLSVTLGSRKVSNLPPGRDLEILVGMSHDLLNDPSYPKEYQVTLNYVRLGTTDQYQDTYSLSLDWYRGLRSVRRRGLHEIAASVEKLQRELGEAVSQGAVQVRVSLGEETPIQGRPRSVPVEFTTPDDPWVQRAFPGPAKDPADPKGCS